MPRMSCTKAKEAFDHVLNVVFQVLKDGSLYQTLVKSGDMDIQVTISFNEADIDFLTYDKSETKKDIPLSRHDKSLLHIFNHYILHCSSIGFQIEDDWLSILQKTLMDTELVLTIVSESTQLSH